MLPLALAIVRHKQSIDKTVLLDNIDPKIIARLADLGIDYYAYSHYNLTTIIHIIKYFLVRGSTDHHSHITHALLNRIRPGEFTPYLQQFTLDCLSILQSTPHSAPKLLWFYHFLLKFNHTQVGRFCIKNMYNNTNLLVLFYLKVLTTINYSPQQVKTILIAHNNPVILHISMNFC